MQAQHKLTIDIRGCQIRFSKKTELFFGIFIDFAVFPFIFLPERGFIMFQTEQIRVAGFDSNFSYLVRNGTDCAIVDPCGDVEKIHAAWNAAKSAISCLKSTYILLTHSHADHVSGISLVRRFFPAPVCASRFTPLRCDRKLDDGERLPLGEGFLECLLTPGHSSDSICYRTSDDSALFTGDTLFVGCCGFCRAEPMFASLRRLRALPDCLTVYSGHDYGEFPSDSLGRQKRVNPYLSAETLAQFRERLRHLE